MADFITNTEMKGPYRWDFHLKNKNMEEQPKSPLAIAVANEFKVSRNQGHEDAIRVIKPVFDKMLAALKAQNNLIDQVHQRSEHDRGVPKEEQKRILWLNAWLLFSNSVQDLEQAIKEAEELGL